MVRASKRRFDPGRRAFLIKAAKAAGSVSVGTALYNAPKFWRWILRKRDTKINSPVSARGKSVKQIIEEWPEIQNKEMVWIKEKGKPGSLLPKAYERGENYAGYFLKGNERSIIHTHPMGRSNIPSPDDICSFLNRLETDLNKTPKIEHIAALNHEGKVMGYFSLRAGKKMVQAIEQKNPALKPLLEELERLKVSPNWEKDPIAFVRDPNYWNILERFQKIGLQMRATSMPGYKFENWHFQEKGNPMA
ncbi:MAG: hypothetical protein PHD95_06435 [Candidatus ainarchaeum sp.]|nr:hypothetical protein [Candidatus ainarchaeum sp.]